jgi:hypothetical protein
MLGSPEKPAILPQPDGAIAARRKQPQGNRMNDAGAAFCRQRATKSRPYNTLFPSHGLFAADKNGCFVVQKHSCDCPGNSPIRVREMWQMCIICQI